MIWSSPFKSRKSQLSYEDETEDVAEVDERDLKYDTGLENNTGGAKVHQLQHHESDAR
jgi:hypothetical protein